ncbi:hypothetical protein ACIQ9Q_42460, partial [Streptomyces sp. NPDC094438]|uniref:hypothetical protein n=1 Tax=Streptomyces sp. NPDC094438 TaxID=3366061 RepID=UPI0038221337
RTTYLYQQKPTNIIATNLLLQTGKAGNEYIIINEGNLNLSFSSDTAAAAHWHVQLNPEHKLLGFDKYYFIFWSLHPESYRLYLCNYGSAGKIGVGGNVEDAQSWRFPTMGGIYDDSDTGITQEGRELMEGDSGRIFVGSSGGLYTIALHDPSSTTGPAWRP